MEADRNGPCYGSASCVTVVLKSFRLKCSSCRMERSTIDMCANCELLYCDGRRVDLNDDMEDYYCDLDAGFLDLDDFRGPDVECAPYW